MELPLAFVRSKIRETIPSEKNLKSYVITTPNAMQT